MAPQFDRPLRDLLIKAGCARRSPLIQRLQTPSHLSAKSHKNAIVGTKY
jgi:hypothetical protein